MNRFVKAAIGGAAGVALLLGGAGSFALWNDSVSVGGGDINSGTLAIEDNGSGSWKNTPSGGSARGITMTDFKAVPGDTLEFTQKLDVTAIGDNLNATLSLDEASLVAPSTGDEGANKALRDELIKGMTVVVKDATNITSATDNKWTVTEAATVQTATVVVTLSFPRGDVGDNTTQTGEVDLSGLTFLLAQD